MVIFVAVLSFIIIYGKKRSRKYYKEYYENDINGIVKSSRREKGGEWILSLSSENEEFRTGIRYNLVKSIKIGDSISKPKYSEFLFQFRNVEKTTNWEYYPIESFNNYEWKRPWSYENEPDWPKFRKMEKINE